MAKTLYLTDEDVEKLHFGFKFDSRVAELLESKGYGELIDYNKVECSNNYLRAVIESMIRDYTDNCLEDGRLVLILNNDPTITPFEAEILQRIEKDPEIYEVRDIYSREVYEVYGEDLIAK